MLVYEYIVVENIVVKNHREWNSSPTESRHAGRQTEHMQCSSRFVRYLNESGDVPVDLYVIYVSPAMFR